MIILERKIRKYVKEEIESLFSDPVVDDFKMMLVDINKTLKQGFEDLDLDLDLIYNVLAGGEGDTAWSTQFRQDVTGRSMRGNSKGKKGEKDG